MIRIADVLQVMLDELIGRQPVSDDVRIHNHTLHALWQKAGFSTDTPVTVSVEQGRLVIEPVKG